MIPQSTSLIIKLKRFLLLVFFVGVWQFSFAQYKKRIDSLYTILQKTPDDTIKVGKLIGYCYPLWIRNYYADARKYGEEALALSQKLKFRWGLFNAYKAIGSTCQAQGDNSEALKNHLASLPIMHEIGDKGAIAEIHNNIGLVYLKLGNYTEALKNYFITLKLSEEVGYIEAIGASYSNIGNIYYLQGNYTEALKNYWTALKIFQEHPYKSYHEEYDCKYGIAECNSYIGIIYTGQGKYQEALTLHLAAIKIWQEIKFQDGIANSYIDIGEIYYNQQNYTEALKNYLAALKLAEEIDVKNSVAISDIKVGKVYIKINKYDEAKHHLMNGLSLSKEIGVLDYIKQAYDGLSELNNAMGNYRDALAYYKLYTVYKDSLLNETSNRQSAQMKEQYESEKKDKEILQLTTDKQISALFLKTKQDSLNITQAEKEKVELENEKVRTMNLFNQQQIALLGNEKLLQNLQIEKDKADLTVQKAEADKKQEELLVLNKEKDIQELQIKKQNLVKNFFIGGLVLLVILSFFVYRNYHTRQKLKLLTLRNKIASDLHDDVGSTLSSISIFSQMAQQQSKEVIPALETIGESSRKMLDAMADIVWTINPGNDEFEKVIMRMRSFAYELLGAKQIDFEFDADEEVSKFNLPMESRKNLYLIFKEATNNMVKYAGADKALFTIKGEKNKLKMMIRDNGKGFDTTKESLGNGLKNMKKRAQEMGAKLFIDSTPGIGTTLNLELAI